MVILGRMPETLRKLRSIREIIADEERELFLKLPVGVLNDMAKVLAVKERYDEICNYPNDETTLNKFIQVIPEELGCKGEEKYSGDLSEEVGIKLNYKDVRRAGLAVLFYNGVDDPDGFLSRFIKLKMQKFKQKVLGSGKVLIEGFESLGGIKNSDILSHINIELKKVGA